MSLNPISQTLDAGSVAFAARWRAWLSQFTQPQLLKLSEAYLGASLFHSSQMGGFARRTLRSPAPAVFLAVGYLNLAHARSLNLTAPLEAAPDIGLAAKLPDSLRGLWEGREPLTDASGVVLGPTGLFEAFSGLRALSYDASRSIAPDDEAKASSAVGRYLRLRLAANGVDWLSELPQLSQASPVAEDVLMGRTVQGDRLLHQLNALAGLAGVTDDELWAQISQALAT